MNRVILMGRLTRDPEVRYSQGERAMAIARYTLAVDRRGRRNQDGNEQTADFINCVAFDRAGEFAEKYFRQGMRVLISGVVSLPVSVLVVFPPQAVSVIAAAISNAVTFINFFMFFPPIIILSQYIYCFPRISLSIAAKSSLSAPNATFALGTSLLFLFPTSQMHCPSEAPPFISTST